MKNVDSSIKPSITPSSGGTYRVHLLAYRPSAPVYQFTSRTYSPSNANTGTFQAGFATWSNSTSNATVLYGQFDQFDTSILSGNGPMIDGSFPKPTLRVDQKGLKDRGGPLRIADTQVGGVFSAGGRDAWDRSVLGMGVTFSVVLDGNRVGRPAEPLSY